MEKQIITQKQLDQVITDVLAHPDAKKLVLYLILNPINIRNNLNNLQRYDVTNFTEEFGAELTPSNEGMVVKYEDLFEIIKNIGING